jgi:hypothetical protein
MSGHDAHLDAQHAELLKRSAISPEVAEARGYFSVRTKAHARKLGFGQAAADTITNGAHALAVPLWNVAGRADGYQLRPDQPRERDGRLIKYESRPKAPNMLDCHPLMRPKLAEPDARLFITEGCRKADALATIGVPCLSLQGVWSWLSSDHRPLSDFREITWDGRDAVLCFDADLMTKRPVHDALGELADVLTRRGARVRFTYLPLADGSDGIDDFLADGHDLHDVLALTVDKLRPFPAQHATAKSPRPDVPAEPGHAVLDDVCAFVRRYVVLPVEQGYDALTLWLAHAHVIDAFESTPRIAFLSPEPASGKSRSLEVAELLVPRPMLAVNATPAALFRAVANQDERPTVLFDEIDTLFGPRAKENEELRGLLNAGHRRSGSAYRCVGEGTAQEVRAFPAFAAVALAGLGDLPDTIYSRSIVLRMRPRRPDERVGEFRARVVRPLGEALHDRLAAWAHDHADELAACRPTLPEGVRDRPADVWEPLLAVAETAGGRWPTYARDACATLVEDARVSRPVGRGVRLLADLRTVADEIGGDHLQSVTLVQRLTGLAESPWADLDGRPLTERRLADLLRPYKIAPTRNKDGGHRGYYLSAFGDAWARYVPQPPPTAQPGKASDASDPSEQGRPAGPNHRASDTSDGSDGSPAEAVERVRAYVSRHGPTDMHGLASALGVDLVTLRLVIGDLAEGPFISTARDDAGPLIGLRP